MNEKLCVICKQNKTISSFYKKDRGYLGVDSKCKSCALIFKKRHYKKSKRLRAGIIELIDDDTMISNDAILLLIQNLRKL